MTIVEMGRQLRRGETTCVALVEEALRQIDAHNPALNAFLTVTAESAKAQASALDAELAHGRDRGPLHGVPYAVKDCYATRGVRTTCGSKLFEHHVPDHDAAVVERLAQAGAVLVGKAHMHELAYGITSNNPHFGPVRNPRDTERVPGGSSGGSASAVAAGMVPFAMGSDTGGSIRIPASFCGCVGLKATSGRVSRRGVLPLDFTLDHMGPLTRTVRDAALVLQAIAGHDLGDDSSSTEPMPDYQPPTEASLAGHRIGLPRTFFFDRLAPAVAERVRDTARRAESLGAILVDVDLPDMAAVNAVGRVILLSEASALLEPHLHRRELFGDDVLLLLDQGRLLPATDYINAQRLRRRFQAEFRGVWRHCDLLLTPTTPTTAPKIGQAMISVGDGEEDVRLASTRLVRGFNVLGLPALSIPCGVDTQGLPVGTQLVGRPFDEALLLRVGAALEA